jgi:hypothetical protein
LPVERLDFANGQTCPRRLPRCIASDATGGRRSIIPSTAGIFASRRERHAAQSTADSLAQLVLLDEPVPRSFASA